MVDDYGGWQWWQWLYTAAVVFRSDGGGVMVMILAVEVVIMICIINGGRISGGWRL